MLISLTVRVSAPPPLLRRQEEKYEPPQVPLESMTYYSQEFTAKQPLPGLPIAINKRETLRVPTMPIETRTTNKETYKAWMQQPALAFGELPSFTGESSSLLMVVVAVVGNIGLYVHRNQ